MNKIEESSGEIINSKHGVPGVVWLAYFKDTEGIVTGILQEDPNAK